MLKIQYYVTSIFRKNYSNELKDLEVKVSGFKTKMIVLGVIIFLLILAVIYFFMKGSNSSKVE